MSQIEQWSIYLFLALSGLLKLSIEGVLLIADFDAIRISYTKHPSHLKRVEKLDTFPREKLPEIAESLDMEVKDEVPLEFQRAIKTTLGSLGAGHVSHVLKNPVVRRRQPEVNIRKYL